MEDIALLACSCFLCGFLACASFVEFVIQDSRVMGAWMALNALAAGLIAWGYFTKLGG